MPRYLWDPEGLPEIEELEEDLAIESPEPEPPGGRGIRARLRRFLEERKTAPREETEITLRARSQVQAALTAWKDAERYFENVSDPELVGFAVYEMEAARRKYLFLLKNAHKIK